MLLPRKPTSPFRLLPNFIIIGAQKCGTTSLYRNLIKHPHIASALRKEVYYFDLKFGKKNTVWYKAYFPTVFYTYCMEKIRGHKLLTGEATPNYIFNPHSPKRVAHLLPQIKLIVMLRNPVDRAYSHYNMMVKKGLEQLSFEDAIKSETERLSGEMNKMLADENYISHNHRVYSYVP